MFLSVRLSKTNRSATPSTSRRRKPAAHAVVERVPLATSARGGLELMRLARERNARVILSGDTRQHEAVEASDALLAIERSLLLPFDQFLFGEPTSDGKEHRLRLIFAMHEVLVRGYNLRRIHLTMQRMELGFLAKLAGSQRSLVAEGQALILEILVTETMPKAA